MLSVCRPSAGMLVGELARPRRTRVSAPFNAPAPSWIVANSESGAIAVASMPHELSIFALCYSVHIVSLVIFFLTTVAISGIFSEGTYIPVDRGQSVIV